MLKIFQSLVILSVIIKVKNTPSHAQRGLSFNFCKGNIYLRSQFSIGQSDYDVFIDYEDLVDTTEVKVKLDSAGNIVLVQSYFPDRIEGRFTQESDLINNVFTFIILQNVTSFIFTVKGKFGPQHPPYIVSLKINGEERCLEPNRTYFEDFTDMGVERFWSAAPDKFCGRRRVNKQYTELITGGTPSKSGHWPWHSAIYRRSRGVSKYICGGTLLSKFIVLTAAHCVTQRGAPVNPEILNVILGKFNLYGVEPTTQEKEIYQIVVHDEFEYRKLNNDIALLKLGSESSFNNYVQPACLWFDGIYDQLDSYELSGTVVGWGIDQTQELSNELREATLPQVPESTCIRYDPIFYINMLNGRTFCVGNNDGTAACNGDSGGGYVVFVPDVREPSFDYPTKDRPGAWYVKGVVSVGLAQKDASVCDPKAYTVFTDVSKYRSWILNHFKYS